MPIFVIYRGELYSIIGRAKVLTEDENIKGAYFWRLLYEAEKTEAALPCDYISNFMIKSDEFYVLPSTLGNNKSEWLLGVQNGKTK